MRVTRDRSKTGSGARRRGARALPLRARALHHPVTLDRNKRQIDVEYLSGPFQSWPISGASTSLSDGSTLVDFWIRYGFKNPVLQMLLDGSRTRAIRYLIGAFEAEAAKRFEPVGDPDLDYTDALKRIPTPEVST
jgi:coenzyme Q-binding protein COQ10